MIYDFLLKNDISWVESIPHICHYFLLMFNINYGKQQMKFPHKWYQQWSTNCRKLIHCCTLWWGYQRKVIQLTVPTTCCSCAGEPLYLQCLGDIIKLLRYKNYTTSIKWIHNTTNHCPANLTCLRGYTGALKELNTDQYCSSHLICHILEIECCLWFVVRQN